VPKKWLSENKILVGVNAVFLLCVTAAAAWYAWCGRAFIKALCEKKSLVLFGKILGSEFNPRVSFSVLSEYCARIDSFFLLWLLFCAVVIAFFLTLSLAKSLSLRPRRFFAVAACFGFFVAFFATSRYGIGVSPDSIQYISVARNIVAGKGYVNFAGKPFIEWAPLFPTILALFGSFGLDPLWCARILNTLCYGCIIFLFAQLCALYCRSRQFVIVGIVALIVSQPLLHACAMAWSEPLFVVLTLLFLLSFLRYKNSKTYPSLITFSLVAAFACLQRYAGVTLVVAGVFLIVAYLPETALQEKVKKAAIFVLIAAGPLISWFVYNRAAVGSLFMYHQTKSDFSFLRNFVWANNVFTGLFLPRVVPRDIRFFIAIIAIASLCGVMYRAHKDRGGFFKEKKWQILAVTAAVYIAVLFIISQVLRGDFFETRIFVPVYPLFILCITAAIESIWQYYRGAQKPYARPLAIGLCAVWLAYPFGFSGLYMAKCIAYGPGGYSTFAWRHSEIVEYARSNRFDGHVYSNISDVLYMYAELRATHLSGMKKDLKLFEKTLTRHKDNYIVWCYNTMRPIRTYVPQQLKPFARVDMIKELQDGAIYRVKKL